MDNPVLCWDTTVTPSIVGSGPAENWIRSHLARTALDLTFVDQRLGDFLPLLRPAHKSNGDGYPPLR